MYISLPKGKTTQILNFFCWCLCFFRMAVYIKTLPSDVRDEIQEFVSLDRRTPAFARHLRKTNPGKNKFLKSIEKIRQTFSGGASPDYQVRIKLWKRNSVWYEILLCGDCGNYLSCKTLSTSRGGRFGRRWGLSDHACCWCPPPDDFY